jgi:hypothetical protein
MPMTNPPEQQRHAILRTVVILALVVVAIFAWTLWRGVR